MTKQSFEEKIRGNQKEIEDSKLDFSILRYFWQASPLSGTGEHLIPKFLKNLKIFKEFSNDELRILSKFLHLRSFSPKEIIFNQDEIGFGFYLVLSGNVEIFSRVDFKKENDDAQWFQNEVGENFVLLASLEKNEYFGELALLEENSLRSATAIAKNSTTLLGLFKPDINDIITQYPLVGAKILQAISVILANRLAAVNREVKTLKYKLTQQISK